MESSSEVKAPETEPMAPVEVEGAEKGAKKKINWKAELIGDYDWGFLCMPRVPWSKPKAPPPFYAKDESISLFVAFIMGLQHCLAMVGGIITVPLLISGPFVANFTPEGRQYIISAALIVSGLATLVQVTQFKIPYTNIYIGSGLLSVMGVSFTFLPITTSAVATLTTCSCQGVPCYPGDTCPTDCPVPLTGNCNTGEEAYGKVLGTILVCCWLQVFISFVPIRILRRIFPPVVTGTTVILIGVALVAKGVGAWGGGAYCAEHVLSATPAMCTNNGQVKLPFGSPEYVGLGFVVFFTLIILELFGSPFLRNVQVAMGLMVGMIVASAVSYTSCIEPETCTKNCFSVLPQGMTFNSTTGQVYGTPTDITFSNSTVCETDCVPTGEQTCTTLRYVTGDTISKAKWITFLWVETFPLGFYGPVVLPMLFGFLVTSMECIGDVTATTEASGLVPVGEEYERAVKGGLLADGLNIFWGALATMLPCVTYAQNNGIISLTRCAARRAGWMCAGLLILLGVIQKFAAIVLTIPDCVLGGMTSFLFANVAVSGMRILTVEGGGINRRNRFIAAMALTLGFGVELIPAWFNISGQAFLPLQGHFWPIDPSWSPAMKGFRDGIIIIMTNGFSIGGFTALLLNLILPFDADDNDEMGMEDSHAKSKLRSLEDAYPHPHLSDDEKLELEKKQHGM